MEKQQPSNYLRVSVYQFAPEWLYIDKNINTVIKALDELDDKPDLFVLPEMFSTGFSMKAVIYAETMESEIFVRLKEAAQRNQTAICGSLMIRDKASYYNRFVFIHPHGELDLYDKKHLFTMGEESHHYKPGDTRELIIYKGWKIFPTVCYDIRFPVWCRNNLNYDLLINVANWPHARTHIWETLLHARALENQCFVVATNRTGTDGNEIEYDGKSMILDAKGEVISQADREPSIINVVLDKHALIEFREKFPVLRDGDSFQLL